MDRSVDLVWLKQKMTEKINSIDWQLAANDVSPFLRVSEQESLKLWSARFFNEKLARVE
jgi:hypothetical protein